MNILLCCDGGFSTSIIVKKMQDVAKEQGKDYMIWAISIGMIKENIDKADIVLVGPHMKHKVKYAQEYTEERNIPIAIINGMDYSFGNGANVIKQAEDLLKQK